MLVIPCARQLGEGVAAVIQSDRNRSSIIAVVTRIDRIV